MVRINKFLAECELGSRRSVEQLIKDEKVYINEKLITDLSATVDPENDIVKVNHKRVTPKKEKIFIMLNKPRKYVVTRKDEFNRRTIYDLLPEFAKTLHPIGRLDYESEGLLLLTNDGYITNKLIHPTFKINKTYKVMIKGKLSPENLQALRKGIQLDNFKTQPAKVFLNHTTDEKSELKIEIFEGKNRQIRKMIESIEGNVIFLKRVSIGDLRLGGLTRGTYRFLTEKETDYLKKV
jgi:23S rRNA pseudouridine2605 synthase